MTCGKEKRQQVIKRFIFDIQCSLRHLAMHNLTLVKTSRHTSYRIVIGTLARSSVMCR